MQKVVPFCTEKTFRQWIFTALTYATLEKVSEEGPWGHLLLCDDIVGATHLYVESTSTLFLHHLRSSTTPFMLFIPGDSEWFGR